MTADPADGASAAHALSVRLFLAALASQEVLTAYLGVRLGLYDALTSGPATPEVLAQRTGLAPRYVTEWLEQQAVAGFLAARESAAGREFSLPPGHARVLTASADPLSAVGRAVLPLGGVAGALPALLRAFADGGGLSEDVFGEDWRHGHAAANRAVFQQLLPTWLRQHVPDHARLAAAPSPRVADVGCGAGWAALSLARTYPRARVTGFDVDPLAVADATRHVSEAGLGDRVGVAEWDATAEPPEGHAGTYDLVCLLDVLHELPRPAAALAGCARLRARGGSVIVLDARVEERFTAPGSEIERFQYATSVLHCLPAGMVGDAPTPTGTALRPATVVELAARAGLTVTAAVELDDRFHRLYVLT